MGKINSKLERLKKLEQEIEKEQSKIDSKLGNSIIKHFDLSYDELDNEGIKNFINSLEKNDNTKLNNDDENEQI